MLLLPLLLLLLLQLKQLIHQSINTLHRHCRWLLPPRLLRPLLLENLPQQGSLRRQGLPSCRCCRGWYLLWRKPAGANAIGCSSCCLCTNCRIACR
jgi:hypothetical protein